MNKIIVVDTEDRIFVKDTTGVDIMTQLQEAVGGYVELVHAMMLPTYYQMLVNEEGQIRQLPLNNIGTALKKGVLVGNIAIAKLSAEYDLIGLNDADVEVLVHLLKRHGGTYDIPATTTEDSK